MTKKTPQSWFKLMNKLVARDYSIRVMEELEQRPDLKLLLPEDRIDSFLKWASEQRLDYKPDIEEEVKDYLAGNLGYRVRMYHTNVKEWKRITSSVFDRDKYTCQYCGKVGGILECDHKIPFSKGGSDELDNLITACRKCNRSKKDKTYSEYVSLK